MNQDTKSSFSRWNSLNSISNEKSSGEIITWLRNKVRRGMRRIFCKIYLELISCGWSTVWVGTDSYDCDLRKDPHKGTFEILVYMRKNDEKRCFIVSLVIPERNWEIICVTSFTSHCLLTDHISF